MSSLQGHPLGLLIQGPSRSHLVCTPQLQAPKAETPTTLCGFPVSERSEAGGPFGRRRPLRIRE